MEPGPVALNLAPLSAATLHEKEGAFWVELGEDGLSGARKQGGAPGPQRGAMQPQWQVSISWEKDSLHLLQTPVFPADCSGVTLASSRLRNLKKFRRWQCQQVQTLRDKAKSSWKQLIGVESACNVDCKFKLNTHKMLFVMNAEDYMYRRGALSRASRVRLGAEALFPSRAVPQPG